MTNQTFSMGTSFNAGGAATAPEDGASAAQLIKESDTANFMSDVIEASKSVPVLVDFWAPWCGPCKQLGPILEKVVGEARGAVKLVKVDIDQSPEIAQQLRIQSIPAVFAFSGGRPIDGFAGALPESQVKEFVAKVAQAAGTEQTSPVDEAMAQAKEMVEAGDMQSAAAIFAQVLQHEPENTAAMAGLAKCLVAEGELAQAREILSGVAADQRDDAEIGAAWSALEMAEKAANAGDTAPLRAAVDQNPADHQARYDLALALYAAGERDEAIDELVEIVRRERAWNDEAARKELLQLFDALGPTDPATVAGRRKLSAVLFS